MPRITEKELREAVYNRQRDAYLIQGQWYPRYMVAVWDQFGPRTGRPAHEGEWPPAWLDAWKERGQQ